MKVSKKLPKGLRKHIRREKSRLRRAGFSAEERRSKVKELYGRIVNNKKQ